MTILITRPGKAGQELVTMLEQRGIKAYHTPLFRIIPGRELPLLPSYLKKLRSGDLIFAVSTNAVNYANEVIYKKGISWPDNVTYLSIGKTTATTFSNVTHRSVVYPKRCEESEHLLALAELSTVSGKQALILRGNGGRKLVGQTLQQRGVSVIYCECYQRAIIDYDVKEIINQWQIQRIDTIVITSNELLFRLFNLVPFDQRSWLIQCRLIVVSERIAKMASQLGWYNVSIVNSANNSRLLKALE